MIDPSLRRRLFWVIFVGLASDSRLASGDDKAADRVVAPAYEEFLVLPLRVHLLKSESLPEVDCGLTDEEIGRVIRKVNGIWNKAGLHWGLETIIREEAAGQGRFRLARDLGGAGGFAGNFGMYRMLLPEGSRRFAGQHVYYLHRFPVNGVWLGDEVAIVQETAKLRAVEGGIDEPLPRVTAHELGHALGLPHRQDTTNLLASGTTGTLLNGGEIDIARRTARGLRGVRTVAEIEARAAEAEAAGKLGVARAIWRSLEEIPGGELGARRNLERLKGSGGKGQSSRDTGCVE